MGKKKVTIKEIADMAGVSIATVSHVINRTRYVSPDLVDKIETLIRETGYQKKIEEKEIYVDPLLVTKDNLEEYRASHSDNY